MKRYNPILITLILAGCFWITYTLVIGTLYSYTLRMMEANCWIHDWVYQFFRWPYIGAAIMGGVATLAMLALSLLLKIVKLKKWMPLSILLACLLAYCYPPTAPFEWGKEKLFSENSLDTECILKYMHMANEKKWSELKVEILKDGIRNTPLGLRLCLLAESAQGTLIESLFSYPITNSEQFLFRGLSGDVECQANRLFYDNLEVWDECFHQTQEYAMCQNDFCLMSLCQMIDYSIKEAEWEVAEKFLCILDEALFYHDFVRERREIIAAEKKIRSTNEAPLRQNNFITAYSFQNEMYFLYTTHVGNRQKELEYLLASILIKKRIEQFAKVFYDMSLFNMKNLPLAYQQAMQIYLSKGQALRDASPGTYAYYFYNTVIPEQEEHITKRPTN